MRIGTSPAGDVYRPVLAFDLRDIPPGAAVTTASLALSYSATAAAGATINVHRVTSGWVEGKGTGTCDGSGASWRESQAGAGWKTVGGDIDAAVEASQGPKSRSTAGVDTYPVTALVQKWANGAPNHGLLLKAASETLPVGADPSFSYSSDEAMPEAARPLLTVTFADGSASRGPSVAISQPVPGATVRGGSVRLAAAAGDDRKIAKVDFLVDGAVVGSASAPPFETQWNSTGVANGTRQLTARAFDDLGRSTTSAATAVQVDNTAPPTASLTGLAQGAAVAGIVPLTATASDDFGVAQVEFYVDGSRIAADTTAPYEASWNTLDPNDTAYDGAHELVAKAYDAGGQVTASAPVTVTTANRTAQFKAAFDLGQSGPADDATAVPFGVGENGSATTVDPTTSTRTLSSAPSDDTQSDVLTGTDRLLPIPIDDDAFSTPVKVGNTGSATWAASTLQLWYRWYTPDGKVLYEGQVSGSLPALAPGASTTLFPTIQPPAVPLGAEQALTRLRFDIYDPTATGNKWFALRGNPPADNPIKVAKDLNGALGFERFWHYEGQDVGGGMSTMTNVANGNMLLRWSPFFAPGRGLATMVDLTYNSLEDHSRSPAGNNVSLSMSGLVRWGERLDLKPPKNVTFVDGDGTSHEFLRVVDPITQVARWQEPPGVNLYLREVTTNPSDRRWGLTRPDNVTFWFDADGYPRYVVDRNGNTITFALVGTPPGEDPGGPKKRVTTVTDAGGRSFAIDYYSKDEAKKAQVRGKIQRITDHTGSALDFEYYDDGNLLRLIQRGGTTATGAALPDRTLVFTYTTSSGDGPAIANPAARVDPEPRTPNQSTRIFSVRDPRGAETTYDYYGPSEGAQLRWKLQSRVDRAGQVTSFDYDLTNRVTTVTAPLDRVSRFTYDPDGKVTQIRNPLSQNTTAQWSADFKVTRVTEPTGRFTTYDYNANGYLTMETNQAGERTELTYFDTPADAADTGRHLSLVATVTKPKGVATSTAGDYQWRYSYDSAGNVDRVTDPTSAVTNYDYNLAGSAAPGTIAAIFDANGNAPTTFPAYDPSGQPTEMRDPLGNLTRVAYDPDGNLRTIQDPPHISDSGTDERSYKIVFDYDAFHRMGRQSAPKSTAADRGQLIWSSVEYDPNDNVVRRVDPHYGAASNRGTDGPAATAVYDSMDRPTLVTNPDRSVDPNGERTTFAYDKAGRMIKQTQPRGVLSSTVDDSAMAYAYDPLDRVLRETQFGASASQARHTHLCYDVAGDLRSVTSPRAGLATVTCPGNGPLTGVSFTATYEYDAAHRRTVDSDPLGNAKRSTYDRNGNVIVEEQDIAAGRASRIETDHDQRDAPITVRQRFDGATGRIVTTRIEYDRNGNRSKVVSPRGVEAGNGHYLTEYSYDGLNRQTRVALPFDAADGTDRQFIHRAYDSGGNLSWTSLPVTSPTAGAVNETAKTQMTYFDPGWIRTSKDPRNPRLHFDYTAQGWQTRRTPERAGAPGELDENRRTSWSYFDDGMLRERRDYQGQPSTYTYDANNNLVQALDEDGLDDPGEKAMAVRADYTGFDETAKVRHRRQGDAVWKFNSYVYDANGNVTQRLENGEENDAGTQTKAPRRFDLSYDANDWLVLQLDLGTDGTCAKDQRIVTAFWLNGLEKQRDIFRAAAGCSADPNTWPKKQTTTWDFFDIGKLRKLVTTNGSGAVTESHDVGYTDDAGRYVNGHRTTDQFILKRAQGNGATTCVGPSTCLAKFEYDARDRLVRHQKRPGKVNTYKLDEPDKLIGDQTIRAGNVTTETKDTGETIVRRYAADQNKEVTVGGVTGKYWYDDFGNLDCLTLAAGSQQNDCNRPGGAGTPNLISDHTYDYLDRIKATRQYSGGTSANDTTTYAYDALDRLTKEIEDHTGSGKDRTTDFTYQGMTKQVTEEKQSGGTNPKTKQYSYDNYGHRISMSNRDNATGTEEQLGFSYDPHGSVSQLLDDAGNVKASYGYDAYGGTDAPASDPEALTTGDTDAQAPINPYRYSGRRMDSGTAASTAPPVPSGSASYDIGARRYGPDLTRFWQQDMFQGALSDLGLSLDPLTQNRYALAGGNPISYVELDGHLPILDEVGDAIKEGFNKVADKVEGLFNKDDKGKAEQRDPPQVRPAPPKDDSFGQKARDFFEDRGVDFEKINDTVNDIGLPEAGAGELGERASKAGRNLRNAVGKAQRRAAQEMSALSRSKSLRSVSRFARSPAGKVTSKGLVGVGFALSFAKHYQQGNKAFPAAAKAGIETAGQAGGALLGAKAGAAVGTAIAPGPGTLIGGAVGAVAGSFVGGKIGEAAVERWDSQITSFTSDAQDKVADFVGLD